MTWFISFRQSAKAGGVADGHLVQGSFAALAEASAGRHVLVATHGFNVNKADGMAALAQLETRLEMQDDEIFIGVLWPGDWWLPAINYPFEGEDAERCGRLLGELCLRHLAEAASLSFLSHSLGARLVLSAVDALPSGRPPVRSICLAAAAAKRDCLQTDHRYAGARAAGVSVLASRGDWVLRLAFPAGDFFGDWFDRDDSDSRRKALGYAGPPPKRPEPVLPRWQIPDSDGVGHGGYLTAAATPVTERIVTFMARAFRGARQSWPPP